MPPVEMHDVESGNIAQIGHDPDTQELHVKFKTGGYYSYANVPAEKYHALLTTTDSRGTLFHESIKSQKDDHPHTKLS